MDIQEYISFIEGELHVGACYAKRYVFFKKLKPTWANWFKNMSSQELEHAELLKSMGEQLVGELDYINGDDKVAWNECIIKYADCIATVKMMLNS